MLIETMQSQGVDSFPALVAATIQGSTETTFYVLAVYFGAVGIQRARHAVGCALLAELAGVVGAIARLLLVLRLIPSRRRRPGRSARIGLHSPASP